MINSLNMAYNMIVSRDYAAAAKLMRFSASYMRYLLRLRDDFVLLQEELEHLRDYLGIQLLRYEGQFDYEFAVDPFVEDISIPSMILQNFVENSIKYSIGPDRFTFVRLVVNYREQSGNPCAVIMVCDNGAGYPDWLLDALGTENFDALRDRVGLETPSSASKCSTAAGHGAVSITMAELSLNSVSRWRTRTPDAKEIKELFLHAKRADGDSIGPFVL